MRWQSLAMQSISEFVSLLRTPFSEPRGLRVLIYHSVGGSVYGDHFGLNNISSERFREHLDILSVMMTAPLLPLEISQDDLRVAITLDDGYADNLYTAAPLLVERTIPFTVFVTTNFIRKQVKGFLSPHELKQLSIVPGATIGGHSQSHCNLTQCSDKELRTELEDSKHYLEDLIGMPVTEFAYPYGLVDMRVHDAVQRAGYELGTCSRFDINRPDRDMFMLNRCVILGSDTSRIFQQKLRGDWDWYRWRNVDPLSIKVAEA